MSRQRRRGPGTGRPPVTLPRAVRQPGRDAALARGRRLRRHADVLPLVAWVAGLAAAHALVAATATALPAPPADPGALAAAVRHGHGAALAFGLARLTALACTWYLTVVTVLGAAARVADRASALAGRVGPDRRAPLSRLTDRWTPALARHVLARAAGASVAVSVAGGVALPLAAGAATSAPPVTATTTPATDPRPPVLTEVPPPSLGTIPVLRPLDGPTPTAPPPEAASLPPLVDLGPATAASGPDQPVASPPPTTAPDGSAPAPSAGASGPTDTTAPTPSTAPVLVPLGPGGTPTDPAPPHPGDTAPGPSPARGEGEPSGEPAPPAHAGAGADGHDDPAATPASAPTTWAVAPGDHLWHIAEVVLDEHWGRAPTAAEVVPFHQRLIAANADRLVAPGNADLILPGQELVVPLPDPDPSAPATPR